MPWSFPMKRVITAFCKIDKETIALFITACAVFVLMAFFHLQTIPQLWFDEGWTLSVAKNWAEHGKYALRLEDAWVSGAGMAQPFSVTLPVGISLRTLGYGIKAARLPMILFTMGCLFALFKLTRRLYGSKPAWVTLFAVLFLAPAASYSPLIFGRQAIGEIPMLFYLLAGYWFWGNALRGSKTAIALASLFWGLALVTKRQTLPFWLVSMFAVLLVSFLWKQRPVLAATIAAVLGALLWNGLFLMVERSLYAAYPTNGPAMQGLYALAGWTLEPEIRLSVLRQIPSLCLSAIVGLVYAVSRVKRQIFLRDGIPPSGFLEIALFSLATSWFAWFVFGSLGWDRYYHPVFMLTAPFFAKVLVDLIRQAASIRWLGAHRTNGQQRFFVPTALVVLWVVGQSLYFEVKTLGEFLRSTDPLAHQTAVSVNRNTEPDALIETYESELFFFLDRTYHYPPDQIQVLLNRRAFLEEDIPIPYNPLNADPDYLIVGPIGNLWGLYEPFIRSGDFELVNEYYNYDLYRRVREP